MLSQKHIFYLKRSSRFCALRKFCGFLIVLCLLCMWKKLILCHLCFRSMSTMNGQPVLGKEGALGNLLWSMEHLELPLSKQRRMWNCGELTETATEESSWWDSMDFRVQFRISVYVTDVWVTSPDLVERMSGQKKHRKQLCNGQVPFGGLSSCRSWLTLSLCWDSLIDVTSKCIKWLKASQK